MTSEQKAVAGKVAAHAFLICFVTLVVVPFMMVVSASFSEGNLAPSRLIPERLSFDHWKFVLGIPYEEVVDAATGETRTHKGRDPSVALVLELDKSLPDRFDRHHLPFWNGCLRIRPASL